MGKLLTRGEVAEWLGFSTRKLDRLRAVGVDFGLVKLPFAAPRFSAAKIQAAIDEGKFPMAKSRDQGGKQVATVSAVELKQPPLLSVVSEGPMTAA